MPVIDPLDYAYTKNEISERFMPRARALLKELHEELREELSEACVSSVERVAVACAEASADGTLPAGWGTAFLRHFTRRLKTLDEKKQLALESWAGLIEVASIASIRGRWGKRSKAQASFNQCLAEVVALDTPSGSKASYWQQVVRDIFDTEDRRQNVPVRKMACMLVWCAYSFIMQGTRQSPPTDEDLARIFDFERENFVRFRQDMLQWLPFMWRKLPIHLMDSAEPAPAT